VLCEVCGETMVAQGYCGVCDAHWTLAPGTPCPKHDLGLEAAPAREEPPLASAARGAWVTVARFADPMRAEAPRIRLEAEGIPTFLDGARMGSESMYQVATGGVKLQVPASLLADARVLLAQSWSSPAGDDDDLDDAWDELGPDPGALRRDLGRVVVLVALVAPLLLSLLALCFGR
jgi:hypothetical protein